MSGINRRNWVKQISAGIGSLALSAGAGKRASSTETPPNIVMIVSDDQAWGDYGFMGHPTIRTPHLDRLASESVVFTRSYVAAPLCCPSLASILTGLHPHQHRVTSNDPPYEGPGNQYNPRQWSPERREQRQQIIDHFSRLPNLASMMKENGYRCMQTGKWWMGHYSQGGFTHGMTHGDLDRGGRHGDEGLSIGREGLQPITDFLEADRQSPFFLWYAPFLPHTPHNPPDSFLSKYREQTDSLPLARYWAMCEWFDETCGQLLYYLDANGYGDNTMILYVCDNGWIQRPDRNGYAERSKRSPYEGGIRTPIMVKWPGHMTPRMDETTLASAVDLVPTALHACGLEQTPAMQGVNLLDRQAVTQREAVFGAAYTHDALRIDSPRSSLMYSYALQNEWKIIVPSQRNGAEGDVELYHVIDDPEETDNRADREPDRTSHMKQLLNNWWSESVPTG